MSDTCVKCGQPLEDDGDNCPCNTGLCAHCCACNDGCGCGCGERDSRK